MCKHGDTLQCYVLIPADLAHDGKARWDWKDVDRCIAGLVMALNRAHIYTASSCCGHGERDGSILLHDGRELIIKEPPNDR